jgi:hypothetical protein
MPTGVEIAVLFGWPELWSACALPGGQPNGDNARISFQFFFLISGFASGRQLFGIRLWWWVVMCASQFLAGLNEE